MSKTVRKKVAVQIADSSGNITAFILNGAKPEEYKGIAKYILDNMDEEIEQTGFVTGTRSFNMSGMELCGNAARAFALLTAMGYVDGHPIPEENAVLDIETSGAPSALSCEVDVGTGYTKLCMPRPKRIKVLKHCEYSPAEGKTVVVMDGIVHLIADGIEYTEENFAQIKKAIMEQFDPDALGVMYLDSEKLEMTPVVFVKDVETTFLEGSCGSGSVAAAVFLASVHDSGTYEYDIIQPNGSIKTTVSMVDNNIDNVYIEGPVKLGEPKLIEIEYEAPDDVDLNSI